MKRLSVVLLLLAGCAHAPLPVNLGCPDMYDHTLTRKSTGKTNYMSLCYWSDGRVTWEEGEEIKP